jgi:ATP-dependent DNA ligase
VPHNGRDLRELPLFERRAKLKKMIIAANAGWLHYSESFDDGLELLKAADRMSGARPTKNVGDCLSVAVNV